MHRGYTKRWRKRWDTGYQQDPLLWVMMDYFIDYANYKDSKVFCSGYGMVELKRGDHIFSLRGLSELLNVDMGKIRRRLKILQGIEFLTLRTTHNFSLASVINYDTYQSEERHSDTVNDTRPTRDRHATDTRPTLPNKEKKEKKVNNKPLELPEFVNKELWAEFKKHRTSIKSPMTPHAEKLCLADLKKLVDVGQNQTDVINQTIKSGKWKSFYEVKKNNRYIEPDVKRASEEAAKRLERFRRGI